MTHQNAGYVSPLAHSSGDDIRIQLCKTWSLLTLVADENNDRDKFDNYDQFKTALHGLMHNRPHQPEY